MRGRIAIGVSLLFLVGCAYEAEPVAEIVPSPPERSVPVLRQAPKRSEEIPAPKMNVPAEWIAPAQIERKWSAIIIHHSGTPNGNAAIFDRWHREGYNWDGVGYDFVIGNGTDSQDGQVEVTFRWRQQRTGAHCKTPENWANEEGVGICLVGDFNYTSPTAKQMQSLAKLVRFLRRRYGISEVRIYGHKDTPGARVTDCPGRNFPMDRLISMSGG
ncbi:MAG: N-acetylmuramoyl-L-alanine amidase [Phycisphaerales bacterium]|nr:MAG: N-acetylmuramoyl-L-alanine amidase [Phycisphaerales bacterium]